MGASQGQEACVVGFLGSQTDTVLPYFSVAILQPPLTFVFPGPKIHVHLCTPFDTAMLA